MACIMDFNCPIIAVSRGPVSEIRHEEEIPYECCLYRRAQRPEWPWFESTFYRPWTDWFLKIFKKIIQIRSLFHKYEQILCTAEGCDSCHDIAPSFKNLLFCGSRDTFFGF